MTEPIKKRNGMLSANDLRFLFQRRNGFFRPLLESCFEKGITFEENGQIYPLIEIIKSGSVTTLALNESPKALKIFKTYCIQKDPSFDEEKHFLSLYALRQMLNAGERSIKAILEQLYLNNTMLKIDGEIKPLVLKINTNGKEIFKLFNHPSAINLLSQKLPLKRAPQKRKGMLTIRDVCHTYGYNPLKWKNVFQSFYDEKQTFFDGEKEIPLIEEISSSNQNKILAIHEHPKAIETFLLLSHKRGFYKLYPPKKQGMLSSQEISQKIHKKREVITALLKNITIKKQLLP